MLFLVVALLILLFVPTDTYTFFCFPLDSTYLVLAGKYLVPGEPFKVAVTLFKNSNRRSYNFFGASYASLPATIQVQISRKGAVIVSEIRECHFGSTELITVKVSDSHVNSCDFTKKATKNSLVTNFYFAWTSSFYGLPFFNVIQWK